MCYKQKVGIEAAVDSVTVAHKTFVSVFNFLKVLVNITSKSGTETKLCASFGL